ncbi:LAMI_0F06392g1_1 [Lachancea mirantina]|uniref:LAMI_0F06392g1_1 n=1 Tax=Lachancea mirantina TaxID=1230905 RepID=A0A1G4JYU9_9SACH|nr:LAMI_0F06392g1_1 [Lachancea mirantina]
MAPSLAVIEVAEDVVLPIRIFVNRRQLLKNIENSKTVFETPILPNNSIIRLKSPVMRIYLSNADMKAMCEEIKPELQIILYELTSKEVSEAVLDKLKVGNVLNFKDVVPHLPLSKYRRNKLQDDTVTDLYNLTTIEKTTRNQYKLHFRKSWELDIYVNDIKKLDRIRNLLLQQAALRSNNNNALPWFPLLDDGSMKIISRRSVTSLKPSSKDHVFSPESATPPPPILQEHSMEPALPLENPDHVATADIDEEDKPILDFKHFQQTNLGKCIDIQVLQRPRRRY